MAETMVVTLEQFPDDVGQSLQTQLGQIDAGGIVVHPFFKKRGDPAVSAHREALSHYPQQFLFAQ
jgi:hypothetical protein